MNSAITVVFIIMLLVTVYAQLNNYGDIRQTFTKQLIKQFGNGSKITVKALEEFYSTTQILWNRNRKPEKSLSDCFADFSSGSLQGKEFCLLKQCLSPEEVYQLSGQSQTGSDVDVCTMSMILLHMFENKTCSTYQQTSYQKLAQHDGLPSPAETWGYGILCTSIIVLAALAGFLALPFVHGINYQRTIIYMVGLAVGTLAGSSLLFLAPEALELTDQEMNENNYVWKCLVMVTAIYVFFIVERVLKIVTGWRDRKKSKLQPQTSSDIYFISLPLEKSKAPNYTDLDTPPQLPASTTNGSRDSGIDNLNETTDNNGETESKTLATLSLAADQHDQRRRSGEHIPQVMRDRNNPLDCMYDNELISKYRIDRRCFVELCKFLGEDLRRPDRGDESLPVSLQIAVAVKYYTTGSLQFALADGHVMSTDSVLDCIGNVSWLLSQHFREYIRFPFTAGSQQQVKQGFYDIAKLPNVLGAIGALTIPIMARKGYNTIKVQGTCDSDYNFLNVVVRSHGPSHDALILASSRLNEWFESQNFTNTWLIGDNSYPLKSWLLTPVIEPKQGAERLYNIAHKRTRRTIDRVFDIWKRRFRCLDGSSGGYIKLSPSFDDIIATAVIHNMCIRNRVPIPDDSEDIGTDPDDSPLSDHDDDNDDVIIGQFDERKGHQTRAELIERVFR